VAAVDLGQKRLRLVEAAELGVVVLDVARGQLADSLDVDLVDDGGEDLLPGRVLVADGDPDDLAALVLARLVAEPDGRGLAGALELVDERRREEVEGEQSAGHEPALLYAE